MLLSLRWVLLRLDVRKKTMQSTRLPTAIAIILPERYVDFTGCRDSVVFCGHGAGIVCGVVPKPMVQRFFKGHPPLLFATLAYPFPTFPRTRTCRGHLPVTL